MSETTSAKPVICDRCGEAIDFRIFPAAIHVVGEKNYHIGCVARVQDPRDAEIASLRAQLDEARSKANIAILDAADLAWKLDEARRKAIEECAVIAEHTWSLGDAVAEGHGGEAAGKSIARHIRALLSESKT